MMQKQSFLKRWFPTFVSFFGKFTKEKNGDLIEIPPLQDASTTQSLASVAPKISKKDRKVTKTLENQPFFLQGLDDLEDLDSLTREGFVQSLGWKTNGLKDIPIPRPEPIQSLVENFTELDFLPIEQVELSKPKFVPKPSQQPLESGDFFLRGLQTIHNIENMKNMELLALLQWEEQGQTLLEVDPDDYDLLDDLLEAAEI